MKWVTRAYVHLDRVASPWLIRRFIDQDAEFVFVPWGEEDRRPPDAIPFALPGTEIGPHDDQGTTFRKLLVRYRLTDPALDAMERIIAAGVDYVLHGYRPGPADRNGQMAVGLVGIAEGMMLLHHPDADIIRASLAVYDALYMLLTAEHLVAAGGRTVPGHADGRGPTSKTDFLRALLQESGTCRERFVGDAR